MNTPSKKDVRREHLSLLKTENRRLRPLAEAILDKTASKQMKIAAISACAAAIVSLHGVSDAFAESADIAKEEIIATHAIIDQAAQICDELSTQIVGSATQFELNERLVRLFSLFQDEHARLESLAKAAGATLVEDGSGEGPDGTSTGKKHDNVKWLMQSLRAF